MRAVKPTMSVNSTVTSRVLGGERCHIAASDQGEDQTTRHVQRERAKAGDHGVEGARRIVQFAETGSRENRYLFEVEVADRTRRRGQARQGTAYGAGNQEDQGHRQQQTDDADHRRLHEPDRLLVDLLLAEIAADQPWCVAVVGERLVEEDVLRLCRTRLWWPEPTSSRRCSQPSLQMPARTGSPISVTLGSGRPGPRPGKPLWSARCARERSSGHRG